MLLFLFLPVLPLSRFPARLCLLLRLLPPERDLRRHHPLPLGDERALGAQAVLPPAVALVALERGHHAVVAAAGALRGALQLRANSRHARAGGLNCKVYDRGAGLAHLARDVNKGKSAPPFYCSRSRKPRLLPPLVRTAIRMQSNEVNIYYIRNMYVQNKL